MAEAVAPSCPLCHGNEVDDFVEVDEKRYWRCSACLLTFLDPDCRLAPEAEYAHYLSHENEINDPGYRAFLSRLATPLLEQLPAVSSGLDYGCGPGPALAHMLREAGHAVALYDPFFAKDETVLSATYDFVTCTEVVEHLFDPAGEFKRFDIGESFEVDDKTWKIIKIGDNRFTIECDGKHLIYRSGDNLAKPTGQSSAALPAAAAAPGDDSEPRSTGK